MLHPHSPASPPSGSSGAPAVPVALREVRKLYRHGQNAVRALDGVSAEFARHSFTAVMGPSGSGKSTLVASKGGITVVGKGQTVPP
jgi:putative ABC transport system ATP-binding protein